jgi:hypothetical protein
MKNSNRTFMGWILFLAVCLGGCVLPAPVSPTRFLFPTPNGTVTALFQNPLTPTARRSTTPQAGDISEGPPALTATITPTAPNCTNLAQFVNETIPDATFLPPGTAFIKTWTLKNIGTCTWGKGYSLAFDHGDPMGAPASVPFTASVPPNAIYTFSLNLSAPAVGGVYQGFWKIQTPQGLRFGIEPDGTKFFWVKITVTSASACAPSDRRPDENGAFVGAFYAATTPKIDGALSEWGNSLANAVPYTVFGTTENTARFSLRWDDSYLYLAVKVTDNKFVQETSGGANLYKGDSVEILLDADLKGDYCNREMTGDDYQLGISPGYLQDPSLGGRTAYLWYPTGVKGPRTVSIGAVLTAAPDPTGWILEARIPWSVFGVSPTGGETYGFVFSVSDNDHPATAQQDGLISTVFKRSVPFNPMQWGTVQLNLQAGQ